MKNLPFIAVVSFTIASCSSVDKNPNSSQNIEPATEPVQKIVWSQDNLNRPQFDYLPEEPELRRTLEGHTGAVLSIDITADGNTLASGSTDGTVKLWEARSGELLRTINVRSSSILERLNSVQVNVAFSPDETKLISTDLGLKVWNAQSGKLLRILEKMERGLGSAKGGSIALSAAKDNYLFVTGGLQGEFKLWNLNSEKLLSELGDYSIFSNLFVVALSPEGDIVVSGNWGPQIKFWDVNSDHLLHSIYAHKDGTMFAILRVLTYR